MKHDRDQSDESMHRAKRCKVLPKNCFTIIGNRCFAVTTKKFIIPSHLLILDCPIPH